MTQRAIVSNERKACEFQSRKLFEHRTGAENPMRVEFNSLSADRDRKVQLSPGSKYTLKCVHEFEARIRIDRVGILA